MRNTKFENGGEIDEMEAANKSEDLAAEQRGENILKAMRDAEAKPKAKSKPKLMSSAQKIGSREAMSKEPADDTKLSLTERMKLSRERARTGSTGTDTRSVNQRVRSAFGMKSGGSVSSRADGIAQRGKTRGKMC